MLKIGFLRLGFALPLFSHIIVFFLYFSGNNSSRCNASISLFVTEVETLRKSKNRSPIFILCSLNFTCALTMFYSNAENFKE